MSSARFFPAADCGTLYRFRHILWGLIYGGLQREVNGWEKRFSTRGSYPEMPYSARRKVLLHGRLFRHLPAA
ncbi:hypothetical protein [Pontibacter harenae]|uniref:hypothetical protein n=1 Tax=Pontibacter harenae TaxID=2894083 RepID=UPI001E3463E8|nr:hypothetical protein [Pontibacter harenae]MCC9169012.1 hypothetical protein [Pontibacter harenae]